MSSLQVEELELLSFFGKEPEIADPGIPWPYNAYVYDVTRDNSALYFEQSPSYRDLRIVLKRGGSTIYELHANGIEDLKYHKDNARESLEIVLSSRDTLWLTLDPTIAVSQELAERL